MQKFYFTFGINHRLGRYVQPIWSGNEDDATKRMTEVFGTNWAFVYEDNTFDQDLIELRPLYVQKTMTFGEMADWTKRLNGILGASQTHMGKRLLAILEDFCSLYPSAADADPHVKKMRKTLLQRHHTAA